MTSTTVASGVPSPSSPGTEPISSKKLVMAVVAVVALGAVLFVLASFSKTESGDCEVAKADGLLSEESRIRVLCVGFLCLQYSTYALLRRYATGILKEEWSIASVLGMGEFIKFSIALFAISTRPGASEAPEGTLDVRLRHLLLTSSPMAVPAVLYLAMNMLGFVSLRRVDAGTFAVVQQSKVFFTALFARVLLGRSLSVPKWCTLTILVLGVTLISLLSQPGAAACGPLTTSSVPADLSASAYTIGLLAVGTDSALSGYATVYFERVLKTTVLTVWDRNLQLAFWSMLIYAPWAAWEHPNPLHGWSLVTLLLALLGAVGGILVALVIKHADGIAKNLATASSIVLTTAAGHVLFNGPMSGAIVVGSLIVIVAGFAYPRVQ